MKSLNVVQSISLCAIALLLAGCSQHSEPMPSEAPTSTSQPSATESGVRYAESNATLEMIADIWGVTDPPKVKVVREIEPLEINALVDECMNDFGWVKDSAGSYTIPDAQRQAFGIANYTCVAQYPDKPIYTSPYTEEHYQNSYEYMRDVILPCIAQEGIDTNELPSFETYKQNDMNFEPFNETDFKIIEDLATKCDLSVPPEVTRETR